MSNLPVNEMGHLTIGGVDSINLARDFGTPLVAYDISYVKKQIQKFQQTFTDANVKGVVSYASKAFSVKAIYQVIATLGAHADIVSAGELMTAIAANFPAANLSFHGNNKSLDELNLAIKYGVGTIVVDNFHELELLDQVLTEQNASVNILLRVTPGISAHTHEYIQTGQTDSKFGFDLESGQAEKALQLATRNDRMNVRGIHAHIGSQIFDVNGFIFETKKLLSILKKWQINLGFKASILNIGGGFGIRYTNEDNPQKPEDMLATILETVKTETDNLQLPLPEVWIEPGRAIVGPAGYSLYSIGSRKDVPGLTSYLAVDGGMGDNIRPALYQADYTAVLAKAPTLEPVEHVHLAGKYCESGDILINDLSLPQTHSGDVVVMLATGAYGYSMASNYNRNPRPAVVFTEKGNSKLVVKRETYGDLIQNDLDY
ncbi:diaminopimelate decarboxylase [Pediococcus claussenii]|uniref:Diaminopimelate decarboxylase n=1 Tax=Pediococcus claussenii (strain ATCC BAA-344 / DSM 14800 / JCM 18046 / KCTC 3811 / LMG 21948 / P06) TaxID=701521 RepID=G8PEU5_PEDCP|nr:diaminopimelate decarboxylase [Pediococcus claussenii]AEV94475.1 diaminopimelate decarboxylase [Pediococcus claussenii ATCC BAA-344]ANZ69694.1 diaminopimelate decarboxylase [Pediococcus claussenii]ANZ71511.1 diaminopimelate decarboxylase [Pediococcus claussenii]KRN19817.1 lysA protein [Pediococcus claussenii]